MVAERIRQPFSLQWIEHGAGVVAEERVVAVEGTGVLCQGVEQPPQRRPGLAVHGVGMGGGHDVRSRRVDLGVDREGRGVHRPGALDDGASVVDQDEVPYPDELEVHAERVDPEVVEVPGIAG